MSRNPPQTPQRTTLPVQTDMPLPMPMPTTADTTERQFSSRRSSPAPPLSICGNVHSSAHPHPSTPGGRPPSLLFGRASPGPLSVTSTGLSLAAGLPSSPSPYLLRSAEIGDYFDRRGSHQDLSLADSPLALRRANVNANTNANANVASSSTGAQRLSSK
jgi:hypothetical protein